MRSLNDFSAIFLTKGNKNLPLPTLLSLWIFLLAVGLIWFSFKLVSQLPNIRERTAEYLAPPQGLIHFTFGYRYPMADTLWLRSIQDFDYCEKQLGEHLCESKGWLFHMLDFITDLSPDFRTAFTAGGLALTIIISDYGGASLIFDKAVRYYPNDSRILMYAAYHAYYEEKDKGKAGQLMESAARAGAPPWAFSLASKLYQESGNEELGLKLYEELEAKKFDPGILKRMKERLIDQRKYK